MHWLFKLVLITAGNAFALWLANRWVAGFVLTTPIVGLILLGLLRQDALFIQGIVGMTADNARLSGYDVIVGGSHGPVPVSTPIILKVFNVAPGKLGVNVKAPKGYKSLEFRTTVGTAAPVRAETFPSTRDIVLEDLESLKLHAVQCRAVFGNKRYSEWSDPVSHTTT